MSVAQDNAQRDFVEEVRHFLAEKLTADLREAGRATVGTHSEIGACRKWHDLLFKQGWIAPAWPVEYGGTGWTAAQRSIFERECADNDAPILFAGGLRSIGPLLIEMGTPDQKQRYLPAILSGADLWCQGFSEPGAGSDLAAIEAKATKDDSAYILNGAKIWTTGAHLSNRMFCLVRTRKDEKPQNGISFLVLDMDTPGLSVEPILMMNGEHEFNQVRFDNVRVPKTNIVGEEHQGWAVAKSLMRHARGSNTTGGHLHRAFNALLRLREGISAPLEAGLERDVRSLQVELEAFDALENRCRQASGRTGVEERQEKATASFLKTSATELHQKMTLLGMQLAGPHAMPQCSHAANSAPQLVAGALATSKYLGLRAASIYSGTNEIHRNLLAYHVQGNNQLVPDM